MEIGGINYLIPVDALLETDKEVQFQAVPLNQVLDVVWRRPANCVWSF